MGVLGIIIIIVGLYAQQLVVVAHYEQLSIFKWTSYPNSITWYFGTIVTYAKVILVVKLNVRATPINNLCKNPCDK